MALKINPTLTSAFAAGEQTRIADEEKRKREREERKSKQFNLINAIVNAGMAYVMSGGNPLAAAVAAFSAPTGDTNIVGSAAQGAAQGSIVGSLYDPAGASGNAAEMIGGTVQAATTPESFQSTATYLSALDPNNAVQSLAAAGQISGQKREGLYKKFQSAYKIREPFIKQYIEAGDMEGASKIYNQLITDNPEFESIAGEIGGLPAFKGSGVSLNGIQTVIGEIDSEGGRELVLTGLNKLTGEKIYSTKTGTQPKRLTAEEAGDKARETEIGKKLLDEQDGTVIPQEGSPEWVKQVGTQRSALTKVRNTIAANERTALMSGTVIEDANRALAVISPFTTGAGGIFKGIPATKAKELAGHIESVKSNIGIDTLLEIKKAGSGLGQVPQKQLETLQQVLGNLDQLQNSKVLKENIERVVSIYNDIAEKAKEENEYQRRDLDLIQGYYDKLTGGSGGGINSQQESLRSKYNY